MPVNTSLIVWTKPFHDPSWGMSTMPTHLLMAVSSFQDALGESSTNVEVQAMVEVVFTHMAKFLHTADGKDAIEPIFGRRHVWMGTKHEPTKEDHRKWVPTPAYGIYALMQGKPTQEGGMRWQTALRHVWRAVVRVFNENHRRMEYSKKAQETVMKNHALEMATLLYDLPNTFLAPIDKKALWRKIDQEYLALTRAYSEEQLRKESMRQAHSITMRLANDAKFANSMYAALFKDGKAVDLGLTIMDLFKRMNHQLTKDPTRTCADCDARDQALMTLMNMGIKAN